MPGWTTLDRWHNNIAYAPGPWIALHRICERHGVGDQFRIHYDPSHAILMGQDTRSLFQYLKDKGYAFLIAGFHVKGQVVDARGVSAWGYGGQTLERGDWHGAQPSPRPADQVNAWKKQTVLCEHELPGTARHDPLAYLQNRTVDWLDHQLAAREVLGLDAANTFLVVEHEYPKARIQDRNRPRTDPCRFACIHARSMKPRRRCSRCSTRSWPGRGFRSRASEGRRIGHDHDKESPAARRHRRRRRGAFIGAVHRIAAQIDGEAELVAGALSSDPTIANESAAAWYLPRAYESYVEMARRERERADGIDFVIVATPNHLHVPVAKAFLEAGIHVICDKPLAVSAAEAAGLAAIATKGPALFALTHNYSGYPLVREARERVHAGDVGELRKVLVEYNQDWLMKPLERESNKQAEWRTDPARAGSGGSVGDIGTHAAHLLEFITGRRIESVCADLTSFVAGRRPDDERTCCCVSKAGAGHARLLADRVR
jgi:hypothetical protein